MFKPGDLVLTSDGRSAVVTGSGVSPQISTSEGVFEEADLRQGHATVVANTIPESPFRISPSIIEEYLATGKTPGKKVAKSSFTLRDQVAERLRTSQLDVDLRGHWKQDRAIYDLEEFKKRVGGSLLCYGIPESDLHDVLAFFDGEHLTRWIGLGRSIGISSAACGYCGAKRFKMETNGKTLRLSGPECPYPDGFPLNEWELNVPSGKIVVANDLRQWFPLPEGSEDFDENGVLGGRKTAQAYASVGMSHAMVGNSCPSVFKLADGQFKIANKPHEDYWDEEKQELLPYKSEVKFQGRQVASICTNLWWYSLCDLKEFKLRTKRFGGSLKEAGASTISVKPGVYRFRHNDETYSQDGPEEIVFATFDWVREPDPIKDFLSDWQEVEVNAHAYVQAQVKRWPTLYGVVNESGDDDEVVVPWHEMTKDQQLSAWARVADHTFCIIGGGTEWHDKGFHLCQVDSQVAPMEPPSFRRQCSWYPFSEGYGGLFRVGHFAPDFAKLAFRLLESVISFGITVHDSSRCREVKDTRDRMLLAVKRYRELAVQYPTLADPEYVQWLSQPGRAENWVERFDLGPIYTEKHLKNKEAQRWVPEGTYAVEFDARKLKKGGHFTASGCWAHKKEATGFAIEAWEDNDEQDREDNCFWAPHAKDSAIPLYSVARVVRLGTVSHMGDTLIEIEFDYGTPWMRDKTARKALNEREHKAGIRLLTKEEYDLIIREGAHT